MKNETFERIYKEYYEKLYRYVFFNTQNREDTEDILQDTFLSAFIQLDESRGEYKSWLYKIARNKMIDKFKSYDNKRVIKNDQIVGLATNDETIEDNIDKKDIYERIMSKLNLLKPVEKEAIVLRFMQEMEYNEIAQIMNKTEGAIRIIISKAMKVLRLESDEERKTYLQLGAFLPISAGSFEQVRENIFNNLNKMNTTNTWSALTIAKIVGVALVVTGAIGAGVFALSQSQTNTNNAKNVAVTTAPTVTTSTSTTVSPTPTVSSNVVVSPDVYAGWNTYTNPVYKYSVRYPSNIAVVDGCTCKDGIFSPIATKERVFFGNPETMKRVNEGLAMDGSETAKDLKIYIADSIKAPKSDVDYDVVSKDITVNGIKGTEYILTSKGTVPMSGEAGTQERTIIISTNNKMYSFSYRQTDNKNSDILDKVIQSFKF